MFWKKHMAEWIKYYPSKVFKKMFIHYNNRYMEKKKEFVKKIRKKKFKMMIKLKALYYYQGII